MNVFQRLKVALTNGLERMQVRREGKRAGKRFAQALEQSPWLQRQFRRSMMSTGGPVLKGKRLARAQKSCCPANLLVQPKGRKYEDGLCNCGQHIRLVQPDVIQADLNAAMGQNFLELHKHTMEDIAAACAIPAALLGVHSETM